MELEIKCPFCNSNQLIANKKGFSGKKAVVGALLTGGIGVFAGTIGSNKVLIICLVCGKQFKPGEGKRDSTELVGELKLWKEQNPNKNINEYYRELKLNRQNNQNSKEVIKTDAAHISFADWEKINPGKTINDYYSYLRTL